jgi:maltoporin
MARSLLRVFVTYANWSDELRGRVGGTPFMNSRHGFTAGVQAETWW